MLVIRPAQMEAFRLDRVEQLESTLEAILRRHGAGLSETSRGEARALVREGILRARGHGIYLGSDLERYFVHLGRHGLDFGRTEGSVWARPVLDDIHASGSEKVVRLAAADPGAEAAR